MLLCKLPRLEEETLIPRDYLLLFQAICVPQTKKVKTPPEQLKRTVGYSLKYNRRFLQRGERAASLVEEQLRDAV